MERPTLNLTLKPRLLTNAPVGIEVHYSVSAPNIAPGQTLFRLPHVIAGIPGAPLDAASFTVIDDASTLALRQEDEALTPAGSYRRWTSERATVGDLHVGYFAPVRLVDATTPNGPFYDLRAEAGGLCGAGVTFLALPDTTTPYDISIQWDLSQAPAGVRGVCSWGEAQTHLTGTCEDLAYMYYMAGPLQSYPGDAGSLFSMYWLSEPGFDPVVVAAQTERMYFAMCEFFQEPTPGFRVFVRKHPYRGNGGTAARRSFMFGYSDAIQPTVESLTALLAHETAHNWPKLDGAWEETGWFDEGTAEYYSITLLRRSGLIIDDAYLELINERARAYYTNPLQMLTNQEAADLFWRDPRAQHIPYGRGLFYFIDLNATIQAHSGGVRSVDDLVLAVVQRRRAGETIGVAEWMELVTAELGERGRRDLEALAAGEWITPPPDALGPHFTRREVESAPLDLGFTSASVVTRVVAGLVAGSPAEQAGVREGDRILNTPSFSEMEREPWKPIDLTLERADSTLHVQYIPLGKPVRSYEWISVARDPLNSERLTRIGRRTAASKVWPITALKKERGAGA
jgi:M61 glycyl aminopeptidase